MLLFCFSLSEFYDYLLSKDKQFPTSKNILCYEIRITSLQFLNTDYQTNIKHIEIQNRYLSDIMRFTSNNLLEDLHYITKFYALIKQINYIFAARKKTHNKLLSI